MKMKDIMLKQGSISSSTQEITCPQCGNKTLYDPETQKFTLPIFHERNCGYLSACMKLDINPNDLDNEKVRDFIFKHFKIRNIF